MRRIFLDPALEAPFDRNGYVIIDLFDGADVEHLLAFYAQFDGHHRGQFSATIFTTDLDVRRRVHDELARAFERKLLPLLDRYRFVLGNFAVKQPRGTRGKVGLHQDITFVDEREQTGLSVWCPLVDVGRENGCLGVVAGSHRFNLHPRGAGFLPYHDLTELIEREYMTWLHLNAGQAVVMDNRLFHGSHDNRSDRTRVVAAGVAVPVESRLLCCHREGADLELYEVPSDFYLRHSINSRPAEGRHLATVAHDVRTLTLELLRAEFTPVDARR